MGPLLEFGMLTLSSGSLWESPAQVLVNTVNCVGVMGKGIALEFKTRWPQIMPAYQRACQDGSLRPGVVQFLPLPKDRWVANFPTKLHWRDGSQLAWIKDGLPSLMGGMQERGLLSVAMPALGCSNGGLSFDQVRPLVEEAFSHSPLQATLFAPGEPVLSFGLHKGKPLSQVPTGYLRWLAQNAHTPDLRQQAQTELDRR